MPKRKGGFNEEPISFPVGELEEIRGRYEQEFPVSELGLREWAISLLKPHCEMRLYILCKYVLGMVDMVERLHGKVADWLQDMNPAHEHQLTPHLTAKGGRWKLLMLPVVHLKTSIASHGFPIHVLIQPEKGLYFPKMAGGDCRILLHGETQDKAMENLSFIRQHFEFNRVLRWLWPEIMWESRKDATLWTDSALTVRRSGRKILAEPSITAIGVGTGLEQRHYDCLAKGTLVYTSNGLIPIEQVQVSARVLTVSGHHREVLARAERRSDKRRARLRIWGQPEELVCTEDHRLLVWRDNRVAWWEARQIEKGDYLAMALPSGRTRQVSRINPRIDRLLLNERVWRLLGYWLAEGAASEKNRIRLTFGATEQEFARDAQAIVQDCLGVNCTISEPTPTSTLVVSFFDAEFKELTSKFGTHAWNKHIPPFVLATEASYQRELLRGYIAGDGHRIKNGWGIVTVSRSLAAGIQLLLARLGIPSMLNQIHEARLIMMAEGAINAGKVVKSRAAYGVQSNHPLMGVLVEGRAEFPRNPCRSVIIPGFMLNMVRSIEIEEPNDEPVYDLQIHEDESFCVPGMTVHNCIIMDDLATFDAAQSEVIMERSRQRRKACRSRLNDLVTSIEIGVGTHWTPNDIYTDWRRDPDVEVCIRAVIEDGEPIWPERHPLDKLLALQAEEGMGKILFSANYMNNPLNSIFTALDWQEVRRFEFDELAGSISWEQSEIDLKLLDRNNMASIENANLYALYGRPVRGMRLDEFYSGFREDEPIDEKARQERIRARHERYMSDLEEGCQEWVRLAVLWEHKQREYE